MAPCLRPFLVSSVSLIGCGWPRCRVYPSSRRSVTWTGPSSISSRSVRATPISGLSFTLQDCSPLAFLLVGMYLAVTCSPEYVKWLRGYLEWYLNRSGRDMYHLVNERAKEQSDLVLDGEKPVEELAHQVVKSVKERLRKRGSRAE